MIKNIALFLSAVGLLASSADARPIKCRFRSSSKCLESVYFSKQLKDGCAVNGSRCRRRFCKANCVDAEKGLVRLCKRGCLDTATLNSLSKREREGLYKTVLGVGSNPSKKELRRALKKERDLFDYRAKRSRGWFSWFRTQPSPSEDMQSLVFEGQLEREYESLIRREKGNRLATTLALRAAAADLVPDPQEYRKKELSEKVLKKWRAHVAKKRAQAVKKLAAAAGVSATTTQQAVTKTKADAIRGKKPKLPVKPRQLRRASLSHKTALKEESAAIPPTAPPPPGGDYGFTMTGKGRRGSTDSGVSSGRSTPTAGNIPPPPPPPPAGYNLGRGSRPATPVGTTEDGFTSANVIPPSSTVKQQPGDLLAALRQNNQAKLKSAKDRKLNPRRAPTSVAGIDMKSLLAKKFKNTRLNERSDEGSGSAAEESEDWLADEDSSN